MNFKKWWLAYPSNKVAIKRQDHVASWQEEHSRQQQNVVWWRLFQAVHVTK
jgi:hypothetical protein